MLRALQAIPASSALGSWLRQPLRLLPPSAALPVLAGPLRGRRWIAGAGNQSCLLGTFEMPKQSLFCGLVRPGGVVVDVGAHAGFYTLLFSQLVGPDGRVVAFEPLPQNLRHLRDHLRMNAVSNVTVCAAAVGAAPGTAHFAPGPNSYTGALDPQGSLAVPVVSLDHLHRTRELAPPDLVKIDVEGAEAEVLRGAREVLRAARPTVVVAAHSASAEEDCVELLRSLGYAVSPIEGDPLEWAELMARHPESVGSEGRGVPTT